LSKTRLSLFYLAGYLWVGGVGLLLAPNDVANLFLSNIEYPAVMLQSLGMFLVGLGIIVVQIIRQHVKSLYPTTLIVRAFICACLLYFFVSSGNPFFLVLFCIVILGVLFTGSIYFLERHAHAARS
jgi:uncharacterized protein YjeT (DUF2065 family)